MADCESTTKRCPKFIGKVSANSIDIPDDSLGPPGVKEAFLVLAEMPNDNRAAEDRLNDSTERQFKIFCRLSKIPLATGDVKGDFGSQDGSSYLVLPDNAEAFSVKTSQGQFSIKRNAAGEKSGSV